MDEQQNLQKEYINGLLQGNIFRIDGKYREAIAVYQRLIQQFGATIGLYQTIASCYFSLGYEDGSNEYFENAISVILEATILEPNSSTLLSILGQFYNLGTLEYEKAAGAYRKAILINPSNINALVNAAGLYGVPENVVTIKEAIEWLKRATSLDPTNPDYHLRLAHLYYEDGQIKDARQECEKALLCPKPMNPRSIKMIELIIGSS